MGINYDKYLARLRQKRQDNPEYSIYRQSIQAMAEPMKQMNRAMQGQMKLAGGSIGAIGSSYLQGQSAMRNYATQAFAGADRSVLARNEALDAQIMQLEMQRDAEEQQRRDNLIKGIITGGATLAGFALGGAAGGMLGGAAGSALGSAVTPQESAVPTDTSPVIAGQNQSGGGAGFDLQNAMHGARLGAGIGGIGSSFVGGVDYNALQQSIGDTLAGIYSMSTLKTQREFLNTFRNNYPLLTLDKDKELLISLLAVGDMEGAQALLESAQSGALPATEPVISQSRESIQENKAVLEIVDDASPGKEQPKTIVEQPEAIAGTGKSYKDWQGMVNKGDRKSDTIKMRNIESFKERGYWIDAKGRKQASRPSGYDEYYKNPEDMTDAELQQTIDKGREAAASIARGATMPIPDRASFVEARKRMKAKTDYDTIFDYMTKNGLAYDSPELKRWVEAKYKTTGTYNKFKKIYEAARGQ